MFLSYLSGSDESLFIALWDHTNSFFVTIHILLVRNIAWDRVHTSPQKAKTVETKTFCNATLLGGEPKLIKINRGLPLLQQGRDTSPLNNVWKTYHKKTRITSRKHCIKAITTYPKPDKPGSFLSIVLNESHIAQKHLFIISVVITPQKRKVKKPTTFISLFSLGEGQLFCLHLKWKWSRPPSLKNKPFQKISLKGFSVFTDYYVLTTRTPINLIELGFQAFIPDNFFSLCGLSQEMRFNES